MRFIFFIILIEILFSSCDSKVAEMQIDSKRKAVVIYDHLNFDYYIQLYYTNKYIVGQFNHYIPREILGNEISFSNFCVNEFSNLAYFYQK